MKAKEVMKKYDICRVTLNRWVRLNKINYEILPSGRYDYKDVKEKYEKEEEKRVNIIYARVSSTTQKDNLPRQIDRIKSFASANGRVVDGIYSEIASALNYNRKQYRKLFNEVSNNRVDTIFVEYKDRLLRIGFEDFEELCKLHNTKIVVVDNTANSDKSKQQEITDDLISIIHHFSSKIYSNRRIKKITKSIKEEDGDNI